MRGGRGGIVIQGIPIQRHMRLALGPKAPVTVDVREESASRETEVEARRPEARDYRAASLSGSGPSSGSLVPRFWARSWATCWR